MSKLIFSVLLLVVSLNIKAQKDFIQLISKMDAEAQYELNDGSTIQLMGYTERLSTPLTLPSPTIRVMEGDSVELELWNMSQAAPHTIHLHGLDVNQYNDGVPSLSWVVEHSEKRSYNFLAPHPGTYLYHCHVVSPIHVQAGMYGLFIVESKEKGKTWTDGYSYEREVEWLTSELDIDWHSDSMILDSYEEEAHKNKILDYDPSYFLLNGSEVSLDSSNSIPVYSDMKTYLRLANIGNYVNKITFPEQVSVEVISSDGRPFDEKEISNEIWVFPGERFGVLLTANDIVFENIQIDYLDMNSLQAKGTLEQKLIYDQAMSINEALSLNSIDLYPNPVSEKLVIRSLSASKGEYSIIDIQGKVIQIGELGKGLNEINLEDVQDGIHFVEIRMGQTNYRHKIIKQK